MAISVSKILGKFGIQPKAKEQEQPKSAPLMAQKGEDKLTKTLGGLETAGRAMVQKPQVAKKPEDQDPLAELLKQQKEFEAELKKKFGITPTSEMTASMKKQRAKEQADIDALNMLLGNNQFVMPPEEEDNINKLFNEIHGK